VPALTPILLNVAMIVGALVAHRFAVPIHALAWSVLAGGLVQLLIQIPALWRLGLLPKPTWGWKHSGVQRVLKLMVPTMFGASVAQVNLLVDVVIATWLVAGSVTWCGVVGGDSAAPVGQICEKRWRWFFPIFGLGLAHVVDHFYSSDVELGNLGRGRDVDRVRLWQIHAA
jgi:hypothetical protein